MKMTLDQLKTLKVGDTVILLPRDSDEKRLTGKVTSFIPHGIYDKLGCVYFPEGAEYLHDCQGKIKTGHGYYIYSGEIYRWELPAPPPPSLKDQIQTLWEGALL